MAREHLVLTKLYCHNNYLTHRRKHLVLMKSTYLTLFGSVRMKLLIETCLVHNRQNNWFSTRHCFSAFCTIGRYLSEIISHDYAAHCLSFAVFVYHFLSYQEGIIQVLSFNDGNYFSETNHYTVTTNYSFTKCKLFLKMNVQFHKKSNLIYDYR